MRILHLLASPFFSGPAENVALLALAQRALGHEVSVAVDRKRPGLTAEEPAVPRLETLGLLDGGGLELSVKSSPFALWRDARRLRGRQVDVVHCHFSHDHWVARWGRPAGALLVRSLHAPRSLRHGLPAAHAYTVSTPDEAGRLAGRRVLVLPALVGPGFVPAPDVEGLRRALGVSGSPLIGMVSTFQPSRRHDVALAAFALVRERRPRAHLVLLGDGGLRDDVVRRAHEAGLGPALLFPGYQQGEAFVRWLQALDEVWILGLGNDWSGRAAAQARACGVRVVAVAEGALPGLADARVEAPPRAQDVARASLDGGRAAAALPSSDEVARRVLALYQAGREGA